MCDCFKTVLEEISEKVKQTVPCDAVEYEIDWKGRVLRFDGGLGVGLYIEHSHRRIKKDGSLYTNKKKQANFIALSYCPFCGEKIIKT